MNSLIVLAAITVALYGKAQCQCSCNNTDASKVQSYYCCNTYDFCNETAIRQQYTDSINCTSYVNCSAADAVEQFTNAANLTTNELGYILNSTIFNNRTFQLVNPNVSYADICIMLVYTLDACIFHRTQLQMMTALK